MLQAPARSISESDQGLGATSKSGDVTYGRGKAYQLMVNVYQKANWKIIKSPFLIGKSTISMGHSFNSFLYVCQRLYPVVPAGWNVTSISLGFAAGFPGNHNRGHHPGGSLDVSKTRPLLKIRKHGYLFLYMCVRYLYSLYIWIGLKNPEILVFTPK